MKKIVVVFITFIALMGCDPSTPDELIDEETYEQMFMEFAIINQLDQNLLQYTTRDELRNKVYEYYGVTEQEFRVSHEYYESQVDQQIDRVLEMTNKLREERDTLNVIERKYREALRDGRVDSLRQELSRNE